MLKQIRTILSVIIITVLLLGGGFPFGEQPAAAAEGEELDLPPIELPEKGNPKLDSQLNQLVSAETPKRAAGFAQESNIELVEGNVRVIIECLPGQVDAATKAASALGVVETSYRNLLQVTVPIPQLTALADTASIRLVRMPQQPLPAAITSEGVALINADEWQTAGYNGTGVKVGILDGGFAGYTTRQSEGELPATVSANWSVSIGGPGTSAHGTACAEIIYDIAPNAQFYLANFVTEVELGNAVGWFISQGVDVISCSMGWPIGGPGDGTGPICGIVDNARAAGILWSQSMGNSAQMHWQGNFVDTYDGDDWHEFSGADETNEISVNSGEWITVSLKWDDSWGTSANDYDLYLYDSSLTDPVAWSRTIQDGDDDPIETFTTYSSGYTGLCHIAIRRYSATETVNFHLYSYYHDLQYKVASSSLCIPADSANAMAVGAVDYSTPTTLELFSSQGPTEDNRIKPDLVAPDGVTSATYSPFYGTSASAPHAAGAAALVKEKFPSYTPAQIQSFLEGRAVPLGAAGKDNLYGSGRLHLGDSGIIVVTTNAADNVTTNSATLNGSLDSLGDYSPVNVSFEWGTEPGVYSDNTTPEAMTSIGSFSANLSSLAPSTTYYFRVKATGSVTVYGSELSFTTLKVLVSIDIAPDNPAIALGRSQQFTATGTYSDNSTDNITGTANWTSDNTSVATIDATGLAQSWAEGTANITATLSGKSDNTTLTVGPKVLDVIDVTPEDPEIPLGRTQQFTATGTYSDNSTPDITDNVTWASDNTSVATIDAAGLAQSLAEGQTTIIATSGNISDNTTLTVGPKELDAIAVTPPNPSIDAGRRQQFTATGTYSDSSTDNITGTVTWSSSNTTVANINAAGLAKSYAEGTTVITATSGNISDNTTLTVGPIVLYSIAITPVSPTITFVSGSSPQTLQFKALARYSDGWTTNVTGTANWTSSNTSVATIGLNTGLATILASGNATISATYSSKTGNTTLTVLPDTVAPVVTLMGPADGQIFSENTTTVVGYVDDLSATASVTVNGGTPIALTLDSNGKFSQSVSLNTGSNTILVKAIDVVGNTGTSGTITVVVDPAKPTVIITQPVGRIVTDNSTLAVMGTASGNVTSANLILNGASQTITVAGGSFSANVTLTEGKNILVVNAYAVGHEGESDYLGTSGERMATLDTTPPVITIDSPVPGSVVNLNGLEVSGTIDDSSVSTANLTLNGTTEPITVVGGTFSQKTHLEPGNNPIIITASDAIGNTSSANVTVIFDNTKPEVAIASPANNTSTNTANQTVTGTVDDLSINTANLTVNGGTPQTISVAPDGSFSENVTLTTGVNTLEVRASDNATLPNIGTSGVVNVTVDNTAPAITIGLNDPTVSITITVTSNEGLAAAPTVSVNSTVTMTPVGVNQWTGTFEPIPAGAYTVTANATDRAGNTAMVTATFCKQTVTISENATETVETATTTLEISTTANVTDASISVTQHLSNPSGNVGSPADAEVEAGVFIEIVASPELRDNLEQIYITVDYDPGELPPDADVTTLKLYLWDVATGTWQVVPGSGVNTGAHYIYGTVTHLSKYGGFGTVKEEETELPPGGGGGGGGGGGPGMVKLNGLTATTELLVDRFGRAQDNYQLKSLDEKVSVDIARKTKLLDSQGEPLESLSAEVVASPPAPPAERAIICAYDFGPDGATFEPAIILTTSYDPEALPEGVIEDELYLAYFDDSQWQALESTVNIETNTTSANISHFTQFALTGKLPPPAPPPPAPARAPAPASFAVSDLSVAPGEVKPAEQVTISAVVTNTGGSRGSYTVVLKVNGAEEARKEVTLGAGKSETVTFTIAKDTEGSYTVNIDGEVGQFTVIVPPPPTPIPTEALPVQPPTNWWLIGGIIAGCVVVAAGLLAYFFVWRKRRAPRPS